MNEIAVAFPKHFNPITSLCVVVGKENNVGAPEGFEKIPIDMNAGRPRAKEGHMYLCVKRDPKEQPVTDLLLYTFGKWLFPCGRV